MLAELRAFLEGKRVLVLGVGNRFRGDDAAGSLLVARLQGKVNSPLIDAEDVPENYLGPIERSGAEVVLVVDATNFGANAGDVALFDIRQAQGRSVSTHTANLGLLFQAIPVEVRPQVILLGIQPGSIAPGEGVSEPVRETLDSLEGLLLSLL